jgi:tyrosyl-tRNA synthetase
MVAGAATDDLPTTRVVPLASVVDALVAAGLAKSRSDARRLVEGGGVRIDGKIVANPHTCVGDVLHSQRDAVLRVGKARGVRISLVLDLT